MDRLFAVEAQTSSFFAFLLEDVLVLVVDADLIQYQRPGHMGIVSERKKNERTRGRRVRRVVETHHVDGGDIESLRSHHDA